MASSSAAAAACPTRRIPSALGSSSRPSVVPRDREIRPSVHPLAERHSRSQALFGLGPAPEGVRESARGAIDGPGLGDHDACAGGQELVQRRRERSVLERCADVGGPEHGRPPGEAAGRAQQLPRRRRSPSLRARRRGRRAPATAAPRRRTTTPDDRASPARADQRLQLRNPPLGQTEAPHAER